MNMGHTQGSKAASDGDTGGTGLWVVHIPLSAGSIWGWNTRFEWNFSQKHAVRAEDGIH